MKIRLLLFFVLPAVLLGIGFSAQAQNNSPEAHLAGTLLDSSGAGVPNVHVTARLEGDKSAQLWKASSTTDGTYSLSLPPGRYHVSFERSPFVARAFDVDLHANQQRQLVLHLELEPLNSNVIVTAQVEPTLVDQTTAPVSVITRQEIDERQSVGLADVLTFAPGIAIGRTGPEGSTASVFLNGGNSNFTKVLIDGAPINPPGGAVDFSSVTLDNIDKAEIVRGAESAIYGTDAVSGVIQLFTHRGSTRTPEFSIYGEGGSFASGRGGGQLSGLLGALDYSVGGSYFGTVGQGQDDDFLNRTLSGNFGYSFSDTNQIRLTLRNNDSIAAKLSLSRRISTSVTRSTFSVPALAGISPPASTGATKSAAPSPTLGKQTTIPCKAFSPPIPTRSARKATPRPYQPLSSAISPETAISNTTALTSPRKQVI
jgi:outer membrane receptor protein involved in Fe transport